MFSNIPSFIVKAVVALAEKWSWLGNCLNTIGINASVNVCRHRPHPWSTVHDYVSWTSLTDQRWSARHLPTKYTTGLPPTENLIWMFKRPTGEQRLCHKSTCLFPAFAQYLTDGFIRTRMPNTSAGETDEVRLQNTSNHQIDLCPLYGRTQAQTDVLRLKSETPGQRGRLKSQFIDKEEYPPFLFGSDGRIRPEFSGLDTPLGLDNFPDAGLRSKLFAVGGDRANASPQVSMMNTLFLREHNRLAGIIETQNANWNDEHVFQVARNIVVVMFIKIVVEEYINHISPAPFRLRADPSVAWNAPWNKPNWITAEFSLLYRWHSLIPDTMTWNGKAYPAGETFLDNRPLLDAGLARAFTDMSAQRACQLGAFNTNIGLLAVEKNAIDQGRRCHLASYGDYREYVSLSRPTDFTDISSDPQVVAFLKGVYASAADVDYYIGLFAEDRQENTPLPALMQRMVAVDAFSQALTNPLLSEHVFNVGTFTQFGWDTIHDAGSLKDILNRNSAGVGNARVSMTWSGWNYVW